MNMTARVMYMCVIILITLPAYNPVNGSQLEAGGLTLEDYNAKQEKELTVLKTELDSLRERVKALELVQVKTDGEDERVKPNAGNYNTERSSSNHIRRKRALRRRRRRVPEVAFQAALSQESSTFKLYDAIIFNDVITNIGGAYKKNTGIFTAPYAGTYSFYTNIVSEKGHYVEASIQVNDIATVSAISDHRVSSKKRSLDLWDQGNAVAILSLQKRDKVSVTVQWPQGSHDIHGAGKSSFSGYLMRLHGHLPR